MNNEPWKKSGLVYLVSIIVFTVLKTVNYLLFSITSDANPAEMVNASISAIAAFFGICTLLFLMHSLSTQMLCRLMGGRGGLKETFLILVFSMMPATVISLAHNLVSHIILELSNQYMIIIVSAVNFLFLMTVWLYTISVASLGLSVEQKIKPEKSFLAQFISLTVFYIFGTALISSVEVISKPGLF